ncbi:MAG: AMP-binding protein [Anaerolineales bacterium]
MSLSTLIPQLAARAPGFARRLAQAGLSAADLRTAADLAALPVIRKDDLVQLQAADPPFGGFLACAPGELKRIFQSPGPIYDPEANLPDYWRWKSALQAAGFAPGDVVINCFGYHLTPAGAMFEEGLWAAGCTVIPGGVGGQEQQARLIADLKVTGYVGLPSYLKALLEKAEELGLPCGIQKAFFTAEPLPPSLRAWLNARGVKIARQGYGTAECGNLGFECERENGWHVPPEIILQICDINSGQPLPDGESGEIVVTLLNPAYALVRFGTGDLSAYATEACSCALKAPRLMGWQGRIGDAVKVRGMFLHPRQLREALARFEGQISAWQAVITRQEHRDTLSLQVEAFPGASASLKETLAKSLRESLKFQFNVEILPAGTLPANPAPIRDERSWE